jgi:hypothetical protein
MQLFQKLNRFSSYGADECSPSASANACLYNSRRNVRRQRDLKTQRSGFLSILVSSAAINLDSPQWLLQSLLLLLSIVAASFDVPTGDTIRRVRL